MKETSPQRYHNENPKNNKNKKHFQPTFQTTIAEFNKVSIKPRNKQKQQTDFDIDKPLRIRLPEYFNIPSFHDLSLSEFHMIGQRKMNSKDTKQEKYQNGHENQQNKQKTTKYFKQLNMKNKGKEDPVFKKRIKDLIILAEGMKRAKNMKQESRYYFIIGVVMHNAYQFEKAKQYFQKFLKIVVKLDDEKSLELALNTIGCQYIYLGNFEKAIEFHQKQIQASKRADKFISLGNIGIVQKLTGNLQEAYSCYQNMKIQAHMSVKQNKQIREQFAQILIQNIEEKILQQQVFMTQNLGSSPGKSPKKSPNKQKSPLKNNINNTSSISLQKMKKSKQYDSMKIKQAIESAEQKMQNHLRSSLYFAPH